MQTSYCYQPKLVCFHESDILKKSLVVALWLMDVNVLSLQEGGDEAETPGNQAEIWWAFLFVSLCASAIGYLYSI